MMVLQAIIDGLSVTFCALRMARATASWSWPSTACTCQPAAVKRFDLIVGGRERGRAVDRDAVVVEQHDQPAEPEMAGQRDRFLADAFHQAAVAADHIGVVIDDVVAEAGASMALGERHADRLAEALAERAGRGLDAAAHGRIRDGRRSRMPSWRKLFSSSSVMSG